MLVQVKVAASAARVISQSIVISVGVSVSSLWIKTQSSEPYTRHSYSSDLSCAPGAEKPVTALELARRMIGAITALIATIGVFEGQMDLHLQH